MQPKQTRKRRQSSVAGLVVAVLLGAVVALGITSLVPQEWRLGGRSDDTPKHAARQSSEPSPSPNDAGDDATLPAPSGAFSPLPDDPPKAETRTRSFAPLPNGSAARQEEHDASRPDPRETKAADLLKRADELRRSEKPSDKRAAERRLEDILNAYPGTKAAVEAERLLREAF